MKNKKDYIKAELKKEPGILLLAYPYTFLWNKVSGKKVKENWKKINPSKDKAVYIHIPFCKRKCLFCNFISYFNVPYALIKKYIGYLKKEMEMLSPLTSSFATTSLCVGGGTPNILEAKELVDILDAIHRLMNLRSDTEMSIEIYPDATINAAKLELLKNYGINRISLGIQSFDNKIKRICNRYDTVQQNIKIYNIARKLGFNNINFDLIFGLPHQSFKSWQDTLNSAVRLSPQHISVYSLSTRHPQVPFNKYMKNADVKGLIKTYNFTREFLTKKGYFQISKYWYIKKGARYKYNECCANLMPCLGLGLNSISYNSNFTYKNTPHLEEFFSALDNNRLPVEKGYLLKGKDIMRNYIIRKITYLRVDREGFRKSFNKDIMYYFRDVIQILENLNLIEINKRYIELTPKGIFYESLVKRCFYDFKILREKEKFYDLR